jgi:hypothetical protein
MSVVEAAKEMIQEKGPLPVVAAGQDPSALRVSDIATRTW